MMKRIKGILAFSLIISTDFAFGDMFLNVVNREDPCVNLCGKTPLLVMNDASATQTNYLKSCCQRGCRFFKIVDLTLTRVQVTDSVNGTRDACETSCSEAYTDNSGRNACRTGCDFMATQQFSNLMSLFSVAVLVDENVDSNVLLMSPDIPENDILTDLSLRKELIPGWWDSDGFKLPQTYVKTVPIDSETIDYGIPSDYSGENEQSNSSPGSDWLQCASRHTGIPRWLLGSAIVGACLSILWLCLFPKETNDLDVGIKDEEKQNLPSQMMVYIPDEAPLYKTPPPKYSVLEI